MKTHIELKNGMVLFTNPESPTVKMAGIPLSQLAFRSMDGNFSQDGKQIISPAPGKPIPLWVGGCGLSLIFEDITIEDLMAVILK